MNELRIKHLIKNAARSRKQIVLYYMQQSQRVYHNHALAFAIDIANELDLPLIVVFNIVENYPHANLRHYRFMLEGIREVAAKLEERKIEFVVSVGNPLTNLRSFYDLSRVIITDVGYTLIQRQWRKELYLDIINSDKDIDHYSVESDVIVPVEVASCKAEYGAYTLRPKITRIIQQFIDHPQLQQIRNTTPVAIPSGINIHDIDGILSRLQIHKDVPTSPVFHGGHQEAMARLTVFIREKLGSYQEANDPGLDLTSKLSPYLHFGQVSPLEIYEAIWAQDENIANKEAFLEQLVVRRELAINYVFYTNDYLDFHYMTEPWAYKTMIQHENDPREYLYTIDDYLSCRTHDPYFNAAMKEMLITGYMHNYMRMYWAKKIIEWSRTFIKAYESIKFMNDKYLLDGRDPSSYAGIAWCFGKHDRAWPERPIFGKLRYMNASGLKRKYHIDQYLERINQLGSPTL